MKDIVIIGAGGFGREVAWLIEDINKSKKEWNLLGFVDDDDKLMGKDFNGYRVIGNTNWLKDQELFVINAVSAPDIKKKIIKKLENSKNRYAVLIHPSVMLSDWVRIGEGTIVCAGSILTTNIRIGKHVIIYLGCVLTHDDIIGDFSTILPSVNISGNVTIGEGVTIGTGTAVIQGIFIGDNATVGAGSVVVRDIPANCTAVGTPAKPIKFHGQN